MDSSVLHHHADPLRAFRARAERYIRANLRDHSLNVARIAGALGCSTRYVHLAFSRDGVTASRYIWSSRLEQCQREIMGNAVPSNLTHLALTWGFRSGAHFSRSFKRAFGIAPSFLLYGTWNRAPLGCVPRWTSRRRLSPEATRPPHDHGR